MSSVSGLLITVRTARQGAAMVGGKATAEYRAEIATVRMAAEDLAQLGLAPGQNARLTSAYGEAVVACQPVAGPRGLFFLPLGPVANRLVGAASACGSGVPDWKGTAAVLTPARAGEEAGVEI